MKLLIKLVLRDSLPRIESLKAFFHAGVVDAQKLVLCGSHVDEVRFALAAFLIKEQVHRLICRGLFSGKYRRFGTAFSADAGSRVWS